FEGSFTPLSDKYFALMMPGHSGGANLFSSSSNPETGSMFVISINAPALERYYTNAAEATKYDAATHAGFPREGEGDPENGVQLSRRTAERPQGGASGGNAGEGRALYSQNCQACHGPTLEGNGSAPSLMGVVNQLGESGVRTTVHSGLGEMPAFNNLSDSDLNNLVAFLRNPNAAPGPRGAASVSSRQPRASPRLYGL